MDQLQQRKLAPVFITFLPKMAKGIRVNRPKKTSYQSHQKHHRVKKKERKNQSKSKGKVSEIIDPLTTNDILKKRRTNPKANITLSSKKRRLLLKKLRRNESRDNQMEVNIQKPPEMSEAPKKDGPKTQGMDID